MVIQLLEGGDDIAYALLSGDPSVVGNLSEENRLVLEFIVETIDEIRDELDRLDDYDAGRICGLIAGEIATDVILGAASGGVALAAKSTSMQRVLTRLDDIPGIPPTAFDDLAAISARIARIGAMCACCGAARENPVISRACERLSGALLRALEGRTHKDAVIKVLTDTNTPEIRPQVDPGLADFFSTVFPDMARAATNPDGTADLTKFFTYDELRRLLSGRSRLPDPTLSVDSHHLVRRDLAAAFRPGLTQTIHNRDCPAVALRMIEHQMRLSESRPTIERLINDVLPLRPTSNLYGINDQDLILERLTDVLTRFGRPEFTPILRQHLLNPPPIQ